MEVTYAKQTRARQMYANHTRGNEMDSFHVVTVQVHVIVNAIYTLSDGNKV